MPSWRSLTANGQNSPKNTFIALLLWKHNKSLVAGGDLPGSQSRSDPWWTVPCSRRRGQIRAVPMAEPPGDESWTLDTTCGSGLVG